MFLLKVLHLPTLPIPWKRTAKTNNVSKHVHDLYFVLDLILLLVFYNNYR